MSDAEEGTLARNLSAATAILGLWVLLAATLLPDAAFVGTHLVVGVVVAVVSGWYAIRQHRDPQTTLSSVWFVAVLGAILLVGTLLSGTPGTVAYWSALLASAGLTLLGVVSIVWGSRFGAGAGTETSIFRNS